MPLPRKSHDFWCNLYDIQARFNNVGTYIADADVFARIVAIRDLLIAKKSRSVIVYGYSRHQFVLDSFNRIGDPLIPNGMLTPRIQQYVLTSNNDICFYFTPHATNAGQLTVPELIALARVI